MRGAGEGERVQGSSGAAWRLGVLFLCGFSVDYGGVADDVDEFGVCGLDDLLGELFFLGFVVVEFDFDEWVVF